MSDDPQEVAESLDEDVMVGDDAPDTSGDEYGEGLPAYDHDHLLGADTFGITAVEEDAGESFADRDEQGTPEWAREDSGRGVGQILDRHSSTPDDERELIADEVPATELSPEEAAMHIEPDH